MMMKFSIAGICLLLGASAWAQTSNEPPTATGAGPKIEFDSRSFDFGKVIQGEMIHHDFVVSNSGDQTLHITDVHPGCGCTTAGAWPHELIPGASGKIPIQINSQNLSGNVKKTVTVTSNGKESRVILEMNGQIVKTIDVTPAFAMFHLIQGTATVAPTTVTITNHTENSLTLTSAQSDTEAFSVGQIKTVAEGKEYQISITPNPPFAHGTNGTIVVGTTWSNYVIRIPTYLTVQAAVNFQPRAIMVPTELKQTNTFVITLYSARQDDKFTGATCPDGRVSLVLTNTSSNHPVYQLRATIPAGYTLPPGPPLFVTVQTTDPQSPEIKIPVQQGRPYALPPSAASGVRARPPLPVASSSPAPGTH